MNLVSPKHKKVVSLKDKSPNEMVSTKHEITKLQNGVTETRTGLTERRIQCHENTMCGNPSKHKSGNANPQIRFADTHRCKPHSSSIERGTLRGSSWQTKPSDNGQPWGATAVGIVGKDPVLGWGHHLLMAVTEWLGSLPARTRNTIDLYSSGHPPGTGRP